MLRKPNSYEYACSILEMFIMYLYVNKKIRVHFLWYEGGFMVCMSEH